MKRILFLLIFILFGLFSANTISAQFAERIAYVNSKDLLNVLPEKERAVKSLTALNLKYKDELELMQADYNRKYSDFITFQNSMTESIKLRRMQELYEQEKNINEFMKVAQDDLNSQETLLLVPLQQKIKEAITQVGLENDFICIYDMANPSIAFVTPKAVDITKLVMAKLTSSSQNK